MKKFTPMVIACLVATWFIWGSMYLAIKWMLDHSSGHESIRNTYLLV